MDLRLPHVLALMALVLTAGVVSVAVLAPGLGVPGVVVIDAPWAGDEELAALAAAHGGVIQTASAPGPLGPFDTAWAADRAARGDLTALYSLDPRLRRERARVDARGRTAWRVVVDTLPALAVDARVDRAVDLARELLVDQGGTRPFAVGLSLDPAAAQPDGAPSPAHPQAQAPAQARTHQVSVAQPLAEVVVPLLQALSDLPSYRRSTLVVLGGHHRDGGGRLVLRLDRGVEGDVPADLTDLLETEP